MIKEQLLTWLNFYLYSVDGEETPLEALGQFIQVGKRSVLQSCLRWKGGLALVSGYEVRSINEIQ